MGFRKALAIFTTQNFHSIGRNSGYHFHRVNADDFGEYYFFDVFAFRVAGQFHIQRMPDDTLLHPRYIADTGNFQPLLGQPLGQQGKEEVDDDQLPW